LLLDRYYSGVQFERGGSIPQRELCDFYEVCRIAEHPNLAELSIERLDELTELPRASASAADRRRRVIGRLIRLLEQDGFPSRATRRENRQVHALIESLPSPSREQLSDWIALRSETVSWHQLLYEARRVAVLERLTVQSQGLEDAEIIKAWLDAIVQPVVKCKCPPVTRKPEDPGRCSSCGKTIDGVGSRPSPCPKKQDELKAIGRKYLERRRREEVSR
jgi:hypothetical protein